MIMLKREGVSVIICCYNSSTRIERTLLALSRQTPGNSIPWEIILVDNASSDNTAEFAETIWQKTGSKIRLHIVGEPKPGLANARNCGIRESNFPILIFCDDDNWLDPMYILNAVTILESDPKIAACGGLGKPVFETSTAPPWFPHFAEAYAVGPQNKAMENGKIVSLYGAGLVIRKSHLLKLDAKGFTPLMTGRLGKQLSSSEDTELTNALVLAGFTLHYSQHLQFSHYLTKERLTKKYLHKLFIAFGTDGPVRNLYYAYITTRKSHKLIRNWNLHLLLALMRLLKYLIQPPKKDSRLLYLKWNLAYLKQLLKIRRNYTELGNNIRLLTQATEIFPETKKHSKQFSITTYP